MNLSNNQPHSAARAVLWDMDGTLTDSMSYHGEAWNEILEPLGYGFTPAQFRQTFGLRNDDIVRDYLKLDWPDAELQRLIDTKEERYRAIVRERGQVLLPGAQHWLEYFKARQWRQAIVSSAPRLNVEAVVHSIHLGVFIDTIICAEDVERGKPDPQPFLLAAERLGVNPACCVVVEDAPAGLEGGRRAGMRTIGLLTTHEALAADVVVKTLTDLTPASFEEVTSTE